MSHISEGLLHAHLDGAVGHDRAEEWLLAEAHLSVCEDCRRRLDEARQLRDVAGEILATASAAPGSTPSFEDLVSQAGSQATTVRRRTAWWNSTARLAWAASLMLAVGAGWIGRELLIQTGQDVPTIVQSESVPRVPEQTAVFSDALEADESVGVEGRAGAGAADMDAVSSQRAAQKIAEPPANEPEIALMQKSEQQAAKGGLRQAAEEKQARADRLEELAEPLPERERDAMARLAGNLAAGSTCYRAEGLVDLQRGLMAAEEAVEEEDQKKADSFGLHELRLVEDGTAVATVDGHELAGNWASVSTDSVLILLANGEAGVEMRFERTLTGLAGTANLAAGYDDMADTDPAGERSLVSIRLTTVECEAAR